MAPRLEWRLMQDKIVGAIFPVSNLHISKLFGSDRDVFMKFTKLNLAVGSTIVFYLSGEGLLVGEAKAVQVERLVPDVAWSRYKHRMLLDNKEYDVYVRISPIGRKKRKMSEVTVFELKNKRKYKKKVRSMYPITPSGRYLTKEMIDKIRKSTSG